MTTRNRDTNTMDINISKVGECADYIRYLSLECIERANSGHPGLPLGCAELGVLLYRYILKFSPENPCWINRDRFILSAGHGSMLLYSLLYSRGYISPDRLANFRQLFGRTPGHPEYSLEEGVETTTGPLGQGFANAVGCAIEGKILAQCFNKAEKGLDMFDYTVYTLMGDGCNMEGIGYEAGSLAGHLGLDNLVAVYDSNNISIDGDTEITFTEKVDKRYEALGWHVEHANIKNIEDVYGKLLAFKDLKGKPKLLVLKTTIGEGLDKKRGTAAIHGSPAGIDEIAYFIQHSQFVKALFEEKYGKGAADDRGKLTAIMEQRIENKDNEPLLESKEFLDFMREGFDAAEKDYKKWLDKGEEYKRTYPEEHEVLSGYTRFKLPASLEESLLNYSEEKPDATRSFSGRLLNLCAGYIPQLVGGVADLAGSTKANIKAPGEKEIKYIQRDDFSRRNIAFGVREHVMGAIGNGLALNKVMIPFTSTFFTFFDYMKPAVRLAALMGLNHLFIFSHDSIYVGEDGPTHQPIEHLNALRLIPGIYVFRPASDFETAFSYLYFFQHMNGPAAIVTSRQKIPKAGYPNTTSNPSDRRALYEQFKKGAYIFYETGGIKENNEPDMIFSASGSELPLALETAKLVEERDNKQVRVVSIPCMELFGAADESYRERLFTPGVPLVLIEAASHRGVNLFYGPGVILVDIESFGISAPAETVGEEFGFTAEFIYNRIKKTL
jgi:transketolase